MTRATHLVLAAALVLGAGAPASSETRFPAMQKMCALAGVWTGKVLMRPGGVPLSGAQIEYEALSNGRAVSEKLSMAGSHPMLSVYYQEGDQLMMTHFCSSNTQPRLRTRSIPADLSELKFEFVDSTNILLANWMNIVWLKLEFLKDGRLRQTWKSHDEREPPCVIEVERKPAK